MFEQGLFITAELKVIDGISLEAAKAEIAKFCQGMNSEPGCSLAVATQDREDPRRFIFWERYDDQAAFEAHFNAKHTQDFIALGYTQLEQAFETHLMAAGEE
ncbi:antibiotic biosynthesis monooxygenase [Photobacterium gaetbulicola]|uniref:Antibiotic biosynthesis monooxygenase n=1 Tax=Photobacterium gaetbulicola TaxID=1295392 RepID=A0A0B9G8G3_9GAMM|nr:MULTISPECIES: antibiotic biosynthesis monooxygenase [Photobacterium]KHT65008.1 antibiotic biosynthesis monooxygenase [Photobacterium gaetbulicola]WEM45121.1 antibiotic biosynthesis monooxygenase [Photobacterium sp. DA100]